jgi:3-hydroxyisobutyrate dehydrogenase
VGIGNMGLAMALRLRDRGLPVVVHDIDPARGPLAAAQGADVVGSAAAVAGRCGCVIVAVVDAAQTEAVLFGDAGLAGAMAPGSTVLLCPTIAPADTERFAARLAGRGIACIDAPMSGGPARARAGTMSLMVACADAVFERHRALLEALADPVFRVGERVGDGARTKLVNNLLAAINLAGAAEAVALAERVGLDAARTLAVIERSSGQSWIGSDRLPRAIAGDLAPRAHTTLLAKDARLALEMARAAGFDTPVGGAAAARYAAACAAGLGALDDASLLALARDQRPPGRP